MLQTKYLGIVLQPNRLFPKVGSAGRWNRNDRNGSRYFRVWGGGTTTLKAKQPKVNSNAS